MPLLTRVMGYFPGKRLGWLEDTPTGVVRDWSTPAARYEQRPSGRRLLKARGRLPFANVRAQTLAISISDDPYGTLPAIERLLDKMEGNESERWNSANLGERYEAMLAQIIAFGFQHRAGDIRAAQGSGHPGTPGAPKAPIENKRAADEALVKQRQQMGDQFAQGQSWMILADGLARQGQYGAAAEVLRKGTSRMDAARGLKGQGWPL